MSAPTQPANGNGVRRVEEATARAERVRDRFDKELDGLIEDLRAAREALREEDAAREGDDDDTGGGAVC